VRLTDEGVRVAEDTMLAWAAMQEQLYRNVTDEQALAASAALREDSVRLSRDRVARARFGGRTGEGTAHRRGPRAVREAPVRTDDRRQQQRPRRWSHHVLPHLPITIGRLWPAPQPGGHLPKALPDMIAVDSQASRGLYCIQYATVT